MSLERFAAIVRMRLRSVFGRRRAEAELDEELAWHVDHQVEELVARGMAPDVARTAALAALGGVARRKDEMRDQRRLNLPENLLRDVRYALRSLRHSPGFAIVSVLTLALGIGANAAIFTVVRAVLLRPLPYDEPSQLVVVQYEQAETVAPATFLDWQASARSFTTMAAGEYWTPAITGGERPEELTALRMTPSAFRMLGVAPMLGRVFSEDEGGEGRNHVVVLRHDFWLSRFGGDSSIVGQAVRLNGESYTVLGVMPPGFLFAPWWTARARLWAPLDIEARRADRNGASLRIFGRLAPGVTLEDARTEMGVIAARLEQQYPGTNQHVTALPLREKVVGNVREALLILMAAVAGVLLIACANVAHLQLVRAAGRAREFALRAALGGSRGRIVQQSLVESLMLGSLGGAAGLALAVAGVRALIALAPSSLPRLGVVSMDGTVFGFMLLVTVVASVLFGLAPALRASASDPQQALAGGRGVNEGGRTGGRLRRVLVVSQFAMALVLLAGAGLVIRSFGALVHVEPGFDPSRTLAVKVSVAGTADAARERRAAFFRNLVTAVRGLPGVTDASAINHVPLAGDDWHFPYAVEGQPVPAPGTAHRAHFLIVHPGYFRAMRVPMVSGRDVTAEDIAAGAKVVVVSESFARREWPGQSAVGRRLSVDDAASHPDWFTVVGVVRDVRQGSWSDDTGEAFYFPSIEAGGYPWNPQPLQNGLNPSNMTLVVRAAGDARALTGPIERAVRALNADATLSEVQTLEEAIGQELTTPKFYVVLLGVFAGVALLLAAVGVYGVIAYAVSRRAREIGIRLALGAKRSEAFALVVRQGMMLAAAGTLGGVVIALLTTRFLRTLLFGVGATDPVTFVGVVLLLVGVAFVACAVPARRAASIDPAISLRGE